MAAGIAVPVQAPASELRALSSVLTDEVLGGWREVAPNWAGGAVYANEADVNEPEWVDAAFGKANYERLLRVKREWDGEGVFWANRGVGSEGWRVEDGGIGERGIGTMDGRLCRV